MRRHPAALGAGAARARAGTWGPVLIWLIIYPDLTSVGAIQRAILELEAQDANQIFNMPELDIADLFGLDEFGRGTINILQADTIINQPKLYTTFLLWLLAELYDRLPECGDQEKPRMVFFFDEAHLLFRDVPGILLQKIEQIIRLVRSKGIGVYFVTQSPLDIPDMVLGQLGNRVQHALRAFTPRDQKAVRAVGETFRPNPRFNTQAGIMSLATGQAMVSFLEADGSPGVVEKVFICPPQSDLTPLSDIEYTQVVTRSPFEAKYRKPLFETPDTIMQAKDANPFEDHLYTLGRRMGRHAGYVFTNMLIRGLFHTFLGGRSTIGR